MQDLLDVWDDRRIEAGDEWRAEIEHALNAVSIVVLLISANFLTSKFILDEEVPRLLERRAKQGVRVIPLIVKPCVWTQVKWLSPIQARPKDGRPLSAGNENQIDADLAALANEIATIVKRAGVGAFHETPYMQRLYRPTKFPSPNFHPLRPTSLVARTNSRCLMRRGVARLSF